MTWIEHDFNGGQLTDEKCPECGSRILYNGNYFCEYWGVDLEVIGRVGGECNWALPHPQEKLVDKQISFRLGGYWEHEDENGNYLEVREEPT